MTLKQAIEKAIGSGWKGKLDIANGNLCIQEVSDDGLALLNIIKSGEIYGQFPLNVEVIFLDPLFWQSLGKAMGWNEWLWIEKTIPARMVECIGRKEYECPEHKRKVKLSKPRNWKYQWHRFIDHLADGKDAESFFKEFK